jgi:cytochrome c biogenesis protein CcdA
MKKISFFFLILFIIPFLVFAQNEKKKALYFYSENCDLCQEVDDYFSQEKIWDNFEIKKIEVAGPYNMDYLNEFFDAYGVSREKRGWPVIFFDQKIIVGSQPIIDNFLTTIKNYPAKEFPTPQKIKKNIEEEKINGNNGNLIKKPKNFSFPILASAALIDGLNPCIFSIAIILLGIMLILRKNARAFYLGLSYITGLFVFYFILGLIFGKLAWNISHFSRFFSLSVSLVLIITSLLKIENFFRKNIKIGFWEKIKIRFGELFFKSWFNFILGLISGYILLPCSYQPYLISMQSVFLENFWKAVGLTVIYNLIFILPLLLLMLLFLSGSKNKKLDQWEEKHSHLINIIISIVLLFVGIYLAQNWLF